MWLLSKGFFTENAKRQAHSGSKLEEAGEADREIPAGGQLSGVQTREWEPRSAISIPSRFPLWQHLNERNLRSFLCVKDGGANFAYFWASKRGVNSAYFFRLQKRCPSVILEGIGSADVARQRVHAPLTADLHQLEDGGSGLRRPGRQEAAPEAVGGKGGLIQPYRLDTVEFR